MKRIVRRGITLIAIFVLTTTTTFAIEDVKIDMVGQQSDAVVNIIVKGRTLTNLMSGRMERENWTTVESGISFGKNEIKMVAVSENIYTDMITQVPLLANGEYTITTDVIQNTLVSEVIHSGNNNR